MKYSLISSSENLIEKVAEQLTGIEKDYSSHLVLFPGKRPSHFLRKLIAEKEKSSFIPPLILSMDEFIEHVHDESLGLGGRKLESVDAISMLYQIHLASPQRLSRKSFLAPDTFFPVGMKLYHDLEELYIEGVPPEKVKEIENLAGGDLPALTVKRLQSLSHFYKVFYQKVGEAHFSTRSSRYRLVSENIERLNLDHFQKVIIAGFFALTESEKRIFEFLLEKENTLFIFQEGEGMKRKLSDLGITAVRKWSGTGPEIHCYQSPDSHGQVLGVSAILKMKKEKGERIDENTVIVLPSSETLLPLFHRALNLLDSESYNISLGYPLQRTPLFGFFNHLMEVVTTMNGDRLYVPYYLQFVLHPYTKNIYFQGRADVTRILFHAIEKTLTEKRTQKFLTLSELENDDAVVRAIQEKLVNVEPGITLKAIREHLAFIHDHTIGKMLSFKNVGEFAERLKEVVEYIYQNSTARLHPFFYPYTESFLNQLDILSKSLMNEIRFQEAGSYFTLFKRYMMNAYSPFAGTPLRGLQILGFLETRNLKFESVLVLDANEGILPDAVREDSFLPFKARQMLGLPTDLDREEIMSYHFNALVRGAKEVHLFYVENDQKEKSRFVGKLLWERQKNDGNRDEKKYIHTIQYAVSLKEKAPRPIQKNSEMIHFLREHSFSATSLNTYLSCPLQFYFEYVLGLKEREVVSEDLEKEEIGSFVHRVLFEFFKERVGSILTEKDLSLGEFEKIFNQRFEKEYGKDPTGEIYLLGSQVKRHLEDFIRNYQVLKIKEFRTKILNLEREIQIKKDSFKLKARLDRIEKRDDRSVIIDYKISANKNYLAINYKKFDPEDRDSWCKAIASLQLPFYLLVYSALSGEKPEEIDCMFLTLGRSRIDSEIEIPLFKDKTEFSENFGKLNKVIFHLLKEIVNPDQPFVPTIDPKNQCGRCAYGYLCTN